MVRVRFWIPVAAALLAASPTVAAPMVQATVSHMCCGSCAKAVKSGLADVAWIADVKADPATKSVTVTAKEGMPIDVAALVHAMQKSGFPPQELTLSGAKAIEVNVGNLCCGGCVGPLKTALGTVAWIDSADVKPNSPVRITARAGAPIKLSDLLATMEKAGYSANTVTVVAS